ncbi:MAG: hypothetical protein JXQ83_12805, partial [Candidatus Glassbacteria bacterium]|nr:hypothetical protein [Candidatus Glassbacteria bacterium]
MITYWTGRLSAGFVPGLVQESLETWSEKDLSADERRKVEALARLTADPLGRSRPLADAPGIPASALADSAGDRLFVAGASGQGLCCLELESGRKIWQLDPGQVRRPAGMTLAGELLVVCDRWMNRVLAVSAVDGSLCWTVENAGGERDKLTEPADVALVQKTDCRELWVADRSNHRVCRYTAEGRHLGSFGRRGLAAEEVIWQNTAGPREPSPVFLEFPESIACVKDLDNLVSVFVWDSGNCRVLCFTVAGELKRVIALESGTPAGHRQAFRLRVLESPAGPLPVAVDEVDNALMIWTPQGDLVLRTVLKPALFGKSSLTETARLVADAGRHGFTPALVTSKPSIVSLRGEAFDLPALLQASAAVRPDKARWLLALWESGRGPENGKETLARLWSGPLARMGAEAFACSLLRPERIVDGGLSGNLERVESLTEKSAQSGFGQAASGLSRAVDSRLESLAADLEKNLIGLARPEAEDLEAWAEAQAALDLALFKNRGNNQLEALRRDSTLEPMRQLPDTTRRAAWAYRRLCRELTRREKDPLLLSQRAARLAGRARELLGRRAG